MKNQQEGKYNKEKLIGKEAGQLKDSNLKDALNRKEEVKPEEKQRLKDSKAEEAKITADRKAEANQSVLQKEDANLV